MGHTPSRRVAVGPGIPLLITMNRRLIIKSILYNNILVLEYNILVILYSLLV